MDYFKHYSTASSNKSIVSLMDKFGVKGYAWYFLLVELCCENWDGKSEPIFTFHQRTVREKLRISVTKAKQFLHYCETITSLSCHYHEPTFQISIPKLLEIKTSRNVIKNSYCNNKNRIEENRIEENRIEATPIRTRPSGKLFSVVKIWNKHFPDNPAPINLGDTARDLKSSCEIFTDLEKWNEIFLKASKSDFLKKSAWFNFRWAVKETNASKIIEGNYDNPEKEKPVWVDDAYEKRKQLERDMHDALIDFRNGRIEHDEYKAIDAKLQAELRQIDG